MCVCDAGGCPPAAAAAAAAAQRVMTAAGRRLARALLSHLVDCRRLKCNRYPAVLSAARRSVRLILRFVNRDVYRLTAVKIPHISVRSLRNIIKFLPVKQRTLKNISLSL